MFYLPYVALVCSQAANPCDSHSYQGYIPTLNHMYGETFGNATEKYFLDYRSKTLNSSTYPAKRVSEGGGRLSVETWTENTS